MTRPAIVIGLGGTGQWVLTFLKKELLELGNGRLPPGVKLLAFDTTSRTTAAAGQGSRKKDEQDVRAGAVELIEDVEFVPIGDNVSQLASEISAGRHAHLQWFPARTFLAKLPPAAFATKEGSGQIRQMGRISVFRDLSAITTSQVLSRLRQALQDLQGSVNRDMQLEVLVVGSLAGGTGAGMLVDIALLVRAQAAKLVSNNMVVRGFFVLPRAFTAGGVGEGRDMLARSFAAWRELDRFMIVSERFGLRQINYHETNQDLRLKLDRRAYDVSYMVDPARQTANSLDNVRNEDGLYPALAHCLSAILDDKAGKAYTEFVSTNHAGKLANLPRRPYHSAIGSYTLKVPVYYAREKFSHQLALEVLNAWLAPEKNDKGRVTRISDQHNQEAAAGMAGKQAALRFLGASSLNVGSEDLPNTQLTPLMADIRAREAQRDETLIKQVANGGLTHVNGRYLIALTDISQDDEGRQLLRNITDELQMPIWREVAPSRAIGDTPDEAYVRVRNRVPEVRHEHYGLDTAAGERLRGKYGKALEQAKAAQITRFRKLLLAWTETTLNGQSTDPLVARGGKLGYLRSFYAELIETFAYFLGFVAKVRQYRAETLRLSARTKEAAKRALAFYDHERGKKCPFTFWDNFTHPDAHRAQREYLRAEQRDIDVRKDDVLLDVLAETADDLRAFVDRALAEVESWIAYLATGDAGLKIASLYAATADSLAQVNVNHELDRRLNRVSQIIGEHEYRSDQAHLADALSRLVWHAELGSNGSLRLDCGVHMPTADASAPARRILFRREGDNPALFNRDLLIQLAERPYETLHSERPLAREVSKVYDSGSKLAIAVDKKAEPLYMTSTSPQGPEIVACYIRVHSGLNEETTQYFKEFEREMTVRNPNIRGASLTLVDSEDVHKLTIVRSDDILPSTDFDMWHACRQAYIQMVTDPHRGIPAAELHIFPAEINACAYEAEMPLLLGQDYRTLHPEVVALLEDRERLDMFFRSVALGFIRMEQTSGQPYWVFQLAGDGEPLYLSVPANTLAGKKEEDVFQVIHNFVMEGRDQRPGRGDMRQVDWGRLRTAILTQQRELGKLKAAKLYRQEIEGPKGMVRRVRADVELRRAQVPDEVLRRTIGQEHDDLADLAQVIYLKAIQSVESFD